MSLFNRLLIWQKFAFGFVVIASFFFGIVFVYHFSMKQVVDDYQDFINEDITRFTLGYQLSHALSLMREVEYNFRIAPNEALVKDHQHHLKDFLGKLERLTALERRSGNGEDLKAPRGILQHIHDYDKAFVSTVDAWKNHESAAHSREALEKMEEAKQAIEFLVEYHVGRVRMDMQKASVEMQHFGQDRTWLALVMACVLLVLMIGMALLLTGSLVRPITGLMRAMLHVAEGHLDSHLPVVGKDELGQMARIFNQMARQLSAAHDKMQKDAEQLEEMVQSRTKQLIHAERLATLGTFSAGIAHEINNPNAFITGNVQFLQQFWTLAQPILLQNAHQDSSGRVARFLGEIDKTMAGILDGSGRISKIVDSLKTYSKGGMESDRVECRLDDPVRDAENLLQHRLRKENAALRVTIPRTLMVCCDRQQMAQVFVNLFNNALDAMEEMREQREKRITVEGRLIDRHIWIWVKDNGPGVPESALGKVFDPFFTTKGKTKGTGLGLSIVEGIVKDHRGQITIFSPPEDETEVVMILPSVALYREQLASRKKSVHSLAI
ncbi:MAG: HAMP domain-containing protein [Magnetococcales bacterium]|nr:HAMP domain-containing protein [Magnetococcales bacterium]